MSSDTIDYDEVAYFVMDHPDCSSLEIADAFDITVAKAFTILNEMVADGLAFKTSVRSPTNNKRILGYRMVPWFDTVADNGDGSMKEAEVIRLVKSVLRRGDVRGAAMMLASHNDWRVANGVPTIPAEAVFGG